MSVSGYISYDSGAALRGVLLQGALVYNVDAGAWQTPSSDIFSSCLFALEEEGETGLYAIELPAGVTHNAAYSLIAYLSSATDFDSPDRITEPQPVAPYSRLLGAGGGPANALLAAEVVAAARAEIGDFDAALDADFLRWLSDAHNEALALRPDFYLSAPDALLEEPSDLQDGSDLIVPRSQRAALVDFVVARYHEQLEPDKANTGEAERRYKSFQRRLVG